ncbi:RING-H2 finger protein ATL2-like [Dendrobium catenatum]|uniref:RING-H2 finger protein ATL3 n=1 Tax=Dendrobium catenatum TaxID=906689 RepID=A0A2I0VBB1_9ASPA|nr:RING-H2 finger protein ATL2-like [Dendrobium catenatum]PKU60666.1 RING-H2 finger protein ATL3 [Dendrobium catenatum]
MSTSAPPEAGDAVPGLSMSVTGKVMLSGVIVFFFIFVFILILFLRANRYLGASPILASSPARFLFHSSGTVGAAFPGSALDSAVLISLPVTVFNSAAFKDGMECAVCLAELTNGDSTRFLPGCRHVFHLKCIDRWFASNSTCPICRSSIKLPAVESKNTILTDSEQSSPIINNRASPHEIVMPLDGSEEGSSSSVCSVTRKLSRIMAIDIPRIALESSAFTLHSSKIFAAFDLKPSNLTSLRSILSMGSRFSSGCSSRGLDIEQGAASTASAAAAAGVGPDGQGSSTNKDFVRDLSLVEEVFHMKGRKSIVMR